MHVVQVVQVIPVVQRMGCCSDPGDPDGLENQAGPVIGVIPMIQVIGVVVLDRTHPGC